EQQRREQEMRVAEEQRRAAEEQRRIAEENARRVEEERRRADEARRRAEEEARRAEEQRKIAEEQRRRAEEEQRRADEAKRLAEEQRRQAEEQRRRNEEERARAEEEARIARIAEEAAAQARIQAEKEAAHARMAQEEAERALQEGIKPIIVPTVEEVAATKTRLQYQEGSFHFAVAGISGSGKSSLINALRGLRNNSKDPRVAAAGVVETTSVVARYPDPMRNDVVWYDVPGAGTLDFPDWVYFNDQGLYIFDCILVLTDNRFTDTDLAILRNCARFKIPAFVVRSKWQQHVENILDDLQDEDDEDDDARLIRARNKLVAETTASVSENLANAELPPQRVYVVDKEALVQVVNGAEPAHLFDERDLVRELFMMAHAGR
ncbi:hypothetical protein POSPLADRAFT_1107200, partial [Postia placenta MAD-698-R-SB12]